MSVEVDRKGAFRAEIKGYGLQEKDSGAVGVRLQCQITDIWNADTQAWDDWREHDVEAWGNIWIIKKDNGGVNKSGVESLVKHAGWDGDLKSIVETTWQPTPCQITTEPNEYNGKVTFPIAFVNAYDSVPGGNIGNVTDDAVKKLEAKYGSSLRALVGNVRRNTAPPDAAKNAPSPPPKKQATAPAPTEDIPF